MAITQVKHHYKDLIVELLLKELRVRYKRLALGYLWSVMSPLMYAGLYFVVFSKILRIHSENYPLFLVAGLFPWQWMTNSIMAGPATFISNSQLIKKTLFPRFLIPLVISMQDAIHFAVSIPVILLFMYLFGGHVTIEWVYALPLMILVHFGTAYSLNLIFATLTVFFRDIERFLQIAVTFIFYLTPVLYSETMIPEKYQSLIILHPFAPLMINWRSLFMTGSIRFDYLVSSLLWCAVGLILARAVYRRLAWRFAEVL
jgi:lipopolysaccharide transport system permease protein